MELSAQAVAFYIPFEVVEQFYPTIPEQLQLRIAFWSFPENEEDIRLYSCLANGSADEFNKGETLFKARSVKDSIQIGFHLSASVLIGQPKSAYSSVAIVFDRKRITQCTCTCNSSASWCAHIVALCLHRIHLADKVRLRAPVSESLSRLHRDQLQKFAQYLISELPQQILPTAQRLLDELLSCQNTAINTVRGAPDPTAGPSAGEHTTWCLDENALYDNIRKTLGKFCVASPVVFSDVNYLSSSAPPAATEWQSLLRPLRGREPEGMWNLLSIIREMYKRNDNNAVPLLEIVTEAVLKTDQLLVWWFTTKVSSSYCAQGVTNATNGRNSGSSPNSPYAGSSLCDEVVQLWRIAALKPGLDANHRRELATQLRSWHMSCIDIVKKAKASTSGSNVRKADIELFPGFKPAIEATQLDWKNFVLPISNQIASCTRPWRLKKRESHSPMQKIRHKSLADSASSSSEGFCDNALPNQDSDDDDLDKVYVYDPRLIRHKLATAQNEYRKDEANYFAGIRKIDSEQDILYARAEALYAHGFSSEACSVARQLAETMLADTPNPLEVQEEAKKKRSLIQAATFNMCSFSSTTLAKAWFLCSVLAEDVNSHHLCFDLGLFALEMPRPPGCNKALEVKLAHQEAELVSLLKRIPLQASENQKIRQRAEQLRSGKLKSRGESLLPLSLAAFIFDSLCLSKASSACSRPKEDEELGFDAAVAALGLKANVSEAEHPLLCEGTRRQRGDLAVTMLLHYKDEQSKLDRILEKLLDKEVHPAFKVPSFSAYTNMGTKTFNPSAFSASVHQQQQYKSLAATREEKAEDYLERRLSELSTTEDEEQDNRERWVALRCTSFKTGTRVRSVGMAAIDSSAPETTSSDNSPTITRRQPWPKSGGPPSDSGSSGSDGSSKAMPGRESPTQQRVIATRHNIPVAISPGSKLGVTSRFGKLKRITPTIPNQPSEAGAHFMFELAKNVLNKAGGSSSTSLFTPQPVSQNAHAASGPHRNLHICSFLIGLYALGIHNCVTPNWLSRTYSSHVSWITGQAIEIGAVAINILIGTWEKHLTPPEVATLADRASRGRDPATVRAAAELALSCLPHAHALNPSEIQRALVQCKEQSVSMIEAACQAVESAAKEGGVYPEVLFDVAKRWYELYEDVACQGNSPTVSAPPTQPPQQPVPAPTHQAPPGPEVEDPNLVSVHLPFSTNVVVGQMAPPPLAYANPNNQQTAYVSYGYGPPAPQGAAAYVPATYHHQYTAPTFYLPPPPFMPAQRPTVILPAIEHMQQQPVNPESAAPPALPAISPSNSPSGIGYYMSAYRVGMLALETLSRRVHDDRPQVKYARNPCYGEDVKWLLQISLRMGTSYVQQYCASVVNAVLSPFVLYDVATEAARYLARGSPAHFQQQLRSPMLSAVLNKCQQMFIQSTHQKLHYLQQADHDELISIVCAAQHAFLLSPGGIVQFQEMLQSMRRVKSCKKELWQRIVTALNGSSTI